MTLSFAQEVFQIENGKREFQLPFQLVNDLVVIPVEVNGVKLSFLLDTGVDSTIIFGLGETDSLDIRNATAIFIRGLGGGELIKAFRSSGNEVKVGRAVNKDLNVFVVLDHEISLSNRLGIPIHGIIGYDFLKDFVVEINYSRKKLIAFDPENYQYRSCRRCGDLSLSFHENKPYINAVVQVDNPQNIPVNLLVDSGSGDALWLFQNEEKGIGVPAQHFEDFLGYGIGGSVYGLRSRIKSLHLGDVKFEGVTTSFPDTIYFKGIETFTGRNGSLGAQVLRRFHLTLDYKNEKLRLKPNRDFSDSFEYDMSGITLAHDGFAVIKDIIGRSTGGLSRAENESASGEITFTSDYQVKFSLKPAYRVVELRPNSPAELAGLRKGDMILKINGKNVYRYSLSKISSLLSSREGKRIKLQIERDGVKKNISFKLKRIL